MKVEDHSSHTFTYYPTQHFTVCKVPCSLGSGRGPVILASLSSWGCGYNEVCLTTISVVENFSDVPETCPEPQRPVCIPLLWNFSPWFHFLQLFNRVCCLLTSASWWQHSRSEDRGLGLPQM